MMNRQQQRFLERQAAKMASRITGPNGQVLSSVPTAGEPVSPFLDIKQTEDGPAFRLPVVAVGFIQPETLQALAHAIAALIVQDIAGVAAKASTDETSST
jgi:hypothetical protein